MLCEADCNAVDFCNLENLIHEVHCVNVTSSDIDINPNHSKKSSR